MINNLLNNLNLDPVVAFIIIILMLCIIILSAILITKQKDEEIRKKNHKIIELEDDAKMYRKHISDMLYKDNDFDSNQRELIISIIDYINAMIICEIEKNK